MGIPPGPKYIFQLLPFFLFPPAAVFGLLRLLRTHAGIALPTWVSVVAIVLARPLLSVFQRYHRRYVDRKAAVAHNAFIIPHVEEKRPAFAGLSIIKALVRDFQDGYPGDKLLEWNEKYGNVYQLRLPSDNRVSWPSPCCSPELTSRFTSDHNLRARSCQGKALKETSSIGKTQVLVFRPFWQRSLTLSPKASLVNLVLQRPL